MGGMSQNVWGQLQRIKANITHTTIQDLLGLIHIKQHRTIPIHKIVKNTWHDNIFHFHQIFLSCICFNHDFQYLDFVFLFRWKLNLYIDSAADGPVHRSSPSERGCFISKICCLHCKLDSGLVEDFGPTFLWNELDYKLFLLWRWKRIKLDLVK